eukprot:3243604-Amphidinium_carterae.1
MPTYNANSTQANVLATQCRTLKSTVASQHATTLQLARSLQNTDANISWMLRWSSDVPRGGVLKLLAAAQAVRAFA